MTEQKPSGGAIFKLIPEIKMEMGAIPKSRKMKVGASYAFRGIEDFYNRLQKLLAEKGVFNSPEILDREFHEKTVEKFNNRGEKIGTQTAYHLIVHYRFHFYAGDGSSFTADAIGEGIDYGDKAAGKCAASAHKSALIQVFMTPTEDTTHHEPEPGPLAKEKPTPPPAAKPKPAPQPPPAAKPNPTPAPVPDEPAKKIISGVSHAERIALWQAAQEKGYTKEEFQQYISAVFGAETSGDLSRNQFDQLTSVIHTSDKAAAMEEMKMLQKEAMNECQ